MKEGDMVTVFSLDSKIGTIVGFTRDDVIVMLPDGNFWKGSKRDIGPVDTDEETDGC